jgi:putative transposase
MVKYYNKKVRLMFQDEAGFGRINKPRRCWARKGERPVVPCHHIREYRYLFGAVEPNTGDSCFRILSHCDTICMNYFLKELSETFKDDIILLVCDNASWHKSNALIIPSNIEILHIPPYTPEMNPIEQLWHEIREKGFANQIFESLNKVVERLCKTVNNLTNDTIISVTCRSWLL